MIMYGLTRRYREGVYCGEGFIRDLDPLITKELTHIWPERQLHNVFNMRVLLLVEQ